MHCGDDDIKRGVVLTYLATGTVVLEDNFSIDRYRGWFWDDSSAFHLLCTLFLSLLYQLLLRPSGIRSWRLGTPILAAHTRIPIEKTILSYLSLSSSWSLGKKNLDAEELSRFWRRTRKLLCSRQRVTCFSPGGFQLEPIGLKISLESSA